MVSHKTGTLLSLYAKFRPGICKNTDQCTNTFTEQNVGALAFPRPEYLIQRFSMFSVSWEEKKSNNLWLTQLAWA